MRNYMMDKKIIKIKEYVIENIKDLKIEGDSIILSVEKLFLILMPDREFTEYQRRIVRNIIKSLSEYRPDIFQIHKDKNKIIKLKVCIPRLLEF